LLLKCIFLRFTVDLLLFRFSVWELLFIEYRSRMAGSKPPLPKTSSLQTSIDRRRISHLPSSILRRSDETRIRDVWSHNLLLEFRKIMRLLPDYPVVAMDTEFPGVVARPYGEFRSSVDYQYQLMRANVDLLKIIQIGLSFFNHQGETPSECSTWQFNFNFSLAEDMYAQDSIALLQKSGIDFKRLETDGINPIDFAELMYGSGLLLLDNVQWISFHSGYDFGYLVKMLTNRNLPNNETDFFIILRRFFPNIFDLKYLMKSTRHLKGGLQEIADQMKVLNERSFTFVERTLFYKVRRVGPQHQAGSDSLLTGKVYFKMKQTLFEGNINEQTFSGYLFGLSVPGANLVDAVSTDGMPSSDESSSTGDFDSDISSDEDDEEQDEEELDEEEVVDEENSDDDDGVDKDVTLHANDSQLLVNGSESISSVDISEASFVNFQLKKRSITSAESSTFSPQISDVSLKAESLTEGSKEAAEKLVLTITSKSECAVTVSEDTRKHSQEHS
ncbi:CCR4-NOT transcription complex subunit 7, partial [Trichinella sp. T9]